MSDLTKVKALFERELASSNLVPAENVQRVVEIFEHSLSLYAKQVRYVKYRGVRNPHRDGLYGTGSWNPDQVKAVPIEVVSKMIKHPDVYVEVDHNGKNVEIIRKKAEIPESSAITKEAFMNNLIQMNDAQQLRDTARDEFHGWEPDKRVTDVFKLRELITAHAEAYGSF